MTQKRGEDDEDHHQHDSIEDMNHKSQDTHSIFGPDEDPDLNIYFNPPETLLEYLTNLEEDNLFKINLVQEDEQALDNEKKKIQANIRAKEAEINEVMKNIESLEQSKAVLHEKQLFLEGNMKGGKHKSKENAKMMQSMMNQVLATETSVIEGAATGVNTTKNTDTSMVTSYIEPQSSLMQFYHDQVMKGRAVKFDEIQKISDLINSLLQKAGIQHEDKTNRVDMLRKVEGQLWQLTEKRDWIAKQQPKQVRRAISDDPNTKDLDKLEANQDDERKRIRREKKQMIENAEQLERELKNEAKKKKQLEQMPPKGRPMMKRADKPGPKKEKKKDDKPSQEVIDQIRYLGEKLEEPQSNGSQLSNYLEGGATVPAIKNS